jgi:hypothetical protein
LQFDRLITISAQVQYRGRALTVVSEGYTADQLCDLLDKRFGLPQAPARQQNGNSRAPHFADDGTPTCLNANCSRHGKPLEPSQHGGWYCNGKDSVTGNPKGYCREIA